MKSIFFILAAIMMIAMVSCDNISDGNCVPPCSDDSCCTCMQNGSLVTGVGFLEYAQDCLDGGLHCVNNSGCRLCYNPVEGGHNFGHRPICARFGGNYDPNATCSDDACCMDKQGNNEDDGNGYLEYFSGCAENPEGTVDCIQDHVGCRLCYRPGSGSNVGNRPICRRYLVCPENPETSINPSTEYPETSNTPSTESPETSESPSESSYESSSSEENESELSTSTSPEEPPYSCVYPCRNESCCTCLQNPNPTTGTGYLEYAADCLDGGLHCVDNSGCRLCYNPVEGGHNFGHRPVCQRFGGDYDPTANCSDDTCCIDKQGNNEDDGNGYLEYFSGCAENPEGTVDCIQDHVGCRLCYRPVSNSVNVGNRPVCRRYQNQQNLDAIAQFERENGDILKGVAGSGNTLSCLFLLVAFMMFLI